ncbi:FecR family protein [Flavobacterium reichenbachii]|uniref:Iron dicitrate transport regulator FecR n=1 Tax=Flavobacterium reichenbachii TaxID=362418 RepID=A0A085ZEY0_9FLAO|nr:FecR family protein [Flavobacterium reichenbachii]KFF02994.1 iron dicitrate transport regulator FecR [Flavobacterium reichenbachii]OXB16984.1 iron dicitrate transport regulator FecR [Flavobacterium reichenbachii]
MDEKKLEEELKRIWDEVPASHSDSVKEDSWENFQAKAFVSKTQKNKPWYYYAAAAVVFFGLIGTAFYFTQSPLQNSINLASNVVENKTLEVKTIMLPDSSRVELNPKSKIVYGDNFTVSRKIEIEGEAYFKVKKDKKHPFQVFCNETTTTVLGTSFTVSESDKDKVVVELYEGSVQMNVKGQEKKWILEPGQKFTYGKEIAAVDEFNRFTDFENEKLTAVSAYIQTNYGYKMIIPEEYNNIRITVRINKKEDLKTIVQLMSEMYNLNFEINEKVKQITFQ